MIERQHQLEDALREAYWTMIKLAAGKPVRNLDEQLSSLDTKKDNKDTITKAIFFVIAFIFLIVSR